MPCPCRPAVWTVWWAAGVAGGGFGPRLRAGVQPDLMGERVGRHLGNQLWILSSPRKCPWCLGNTTRHWHLAGRCTHHRCLHSTQQEIKRTKTTKGPFSRTGRDRGRLSGNEQRSRKSASGPQQCRPARLALACALPALLRLTLLSCLMATHGRGVRAMPQRLWEAGSEEASGQSLRRSLRGRVGNGEAGEARGGTRRQGSPGAGEGQRQTQQVARGKGWEKEARKTSRRKRQLDSPRAKRMKCWGQRHSKAADG